MATRAHRDDPGFTLVDSRESVYVRRRCVHSRSALGLTGGGAAVPLRTPIGGVRIRRIGAAGGRPYATAGRGGPREKARLS
jgi:hypothetical protein